MPVVTVDTVSSSPLSKVKPPTATVRSNLGNAAYGVLIGLVELVPGISGGTVALVLGIIDRLVSSANCLISGLLTLVVRRDRKSAARRLTGVEWSLILPLAAGMFLALFALSGPIHAFVDVHPTIASGLFLGMVSASLLVPITMARETGPSTTVSTIVGAGVVLVTATAVFWFLGLPGIQVEEPAGWVIILSGAAAVCALALPGLSGSFILLTFGMYEPTLEAVSTLDGAYLALFIVGSVLGLFSVVQALAYLLRVHRRATLLMATGLIFGSLRALWPWQDNGALLPPDDAWANPLLAGLGGVAVVLLLWWRERRTTRAAAALA